MTYIVLAYIVMAGQVSVVAKRIDSGAQQPFVFRSYSSASTDGSSDMCLWEVAMRIDMCTDMCVDMCMDRCRDRCMGHVSCYGA